MPGSAAIGDYMGFIVIFIFIVFVIIIIIIVIIIILFAASLARRVVDFLILF